MATPERRDAASCYSELPIEVLVNEVQHTPSCPWIRRLQMTKLNEPRNIPWGKMVRKIKVEPNSRH